MSNDTFQLPKEGARRGCEHLQEHKVFWDAALNEAEGLQEGRIKRGQEAACTTAPLSN